MSEFLVLGWNVAIPEVDTGDDIFVVEDEKGTLRRVQVKTSEATIREDGFSAQFQVPLAQLQTIGNILVHYVFIVRYNKAWYAPVIIRQDYLLDYFENKNMGSKYNDHINLYFSYSKNKVICSKLDLTMYIADYTDFPKIEH